MCGEHLPSLLLASLEVSNMQLQFYCPCGTDEDWSPSIVPDIVVVESNVHCFVIVVYFNKNYCL
jgi:hypothetical protein